MPSDWATWAEAVYGCGVFPGRNARKIADKYCRRQAEMGVGDCAGLQLIPGTLARRLRLSACSCLPCLVDLCSPISVLEQARGYHFVQRSYLRHDRFMLVSRDDAKWPAEGDCCSFFFNSCCGIIFLALRMHVCIAVSGLYSMHVCTSQSLEQVSDVSAMTWIVPD